jgi:twinfilin-like protein
MARANLNINPEIFESFQAAQDFASNIRSLKIRISGENLELEGIVHRQSDNASDFNLLKETLSTTDANLVIFCVDDNSEGKNLSWLLFSWIPDACKVRDKMLYSSSREDLKRSLGLGYFSSEYAANVSTSIA